MEARTWKDPIVGWIDSRLPIFSMMQADLVDFDAEEPERAIGGTSARSPASCW